jgi:hypothetical protein
MCAQAFVLVETWAALFVAHTLTSDVPACMLGAVLLPLLAPDMPDSTGAGGVVVEGSKQWCAWARQRALCF